MNGIRVGPKKSLDQFNESEAHPKWGISYRI
jgi:hypothetical protein